MSGDRKGEILSIRHLAKTFAGTKALDDVSLDVDAGEVHALLGQNGSGKSTLIKILSGYHSPDGGATIELKGSPLRLPITPGESRKLGISFMHQDLGLVGTMSVMENLSVGRFETGIAWHVRWREERAITRKLLQRFELDIDPRKRIMDLSQTERAVVGIMRALRDVEDAQGAGLLVLDEPTVSLPAGEVEMLFRAIRRVIASGSSVLFVSHSLEEVLAISTRVSVLRDGRLVARRDTAGLDERSLIELIVGQDLGELYPDPIEQASRETVVQVRGMSGPIIRDVGFSVHKGEILGLTGLIGAGHDAVPYLVYGARPADAGTIEVDGSEIANPNPQRCKAAGLGLLPADRPRQGGIMNATVLENVTVASLGSFRRGLAINKRRERSTVRQVLDRFDVQPASPSRRLATLSGGNQQKALLARWMHMNPRVLILHEPTQGVDVGARKYIFGMLTEAAAAGTSILYCSAEYEDLAHLCDRVLVFRSGRVVVELSGESLTHERIVAACYASNGSSRAGSGETSA